MEDPVGPLCAPALGRVVRTIVRKRVPDQPGQDDTILKRADLRTVELYIVYENQGRGLLILHFVSGVEEISQGESRRKR